MSIRLSSGLRTAILTDFGLGAMMNYGVIEVYTGTQPETAILAPTGLLIGRITTDGDPFLVGTVNGGLKLAVDPEGGLTFDGVWRLKGLDTGTAGWWRWKWNSPDDDGDSLFYPRMDGAVGDSLRLAATIITPVTNVVITDFNVNIME